MNFYKECVSGDGLKKTTWSFMSFDSYTNKLTFVLDSYTTQIKESARKKNFTVVNKYSRLSGRDSNLSESDVPMPEFLLNEIREHVNNILEVKKWSEYKR